MVAVTDAFGYPKAGGFLVSGFWVVGLNFKKKGVNNTSP
jgi:hypothetical protein